MHHRHSRRTALAAPQHSPHHSTRPVISGAAAFAISSRVLVSHAAHARLALALALVLALLLAAYTSGAFDAESGPPSPPPPETPTRLPSQSHTVPKHQHHATSPSPRKGVK